MKISFLIPSFNHEKYLLKCLESVLENRVSDMEVIICDDCSSDNSPLIAIDWISKYKSYFSKCFFIKNSINYGITNTLNEMVAECSGEYVMGVGSDDYVLPGGILERLKYMVSNSHLVGAFCDGIAIGENGTQYSDSILVSSGLSSDMLKPNMLMNTVLKKWIEPMNLQFWRKSVFKSHGGEFMFDGSVYCEDLNFALWALPKKGLGFLNKKCVAYRFRSWPQSSRAKSTEELDKMNLDFAKCYARYADCYPPYIQKYLNRKSLFYCSLSNGLQMKRSFWGGKIDRGPMKFWGALFYTLLDFFYYYKIEKLLDKRRRLKRYRFQ